MTTIAPSTSETSNDKSSQSERLAALPVCDAIHEAAATSRIRQEHYRAILRILARHFDAPYAAINVEGSAGTIEDYVQHGTSADDRWKAMCDGLLLDSRYRNLPIAKLYDSINLGASFTTMAVPIREGSHGVVGSIVIVAQCENKSAAKIQLSELTALVSLVGTVACSVGTSSSSTKPGAARPEHAGVAKAGGYGTLYEFAFAVANGLKTKLGYDQVSLGLARGNRVKVVCISGLDDLYPRSPGARLIRQAMEECVDAGQVVCYQNDSTATEDRTTTGHLLHKEWHHQTGHSSVASIPLFVDGQCSAVLGLRNSATSPFKKSNLKKVQETVAPLIPGLKLMERADRHFLQHGSDALRGLAVRWLGQGAYQRKIILGVITLIAAWLIFGTIQFTVTVPCEVVSGNVRQIAAPYQGTILAAHVKPGDSVTAGQLLLEMDIKELLLQRDQLVSERRIAELDLSKALAGKDHMAASQAGSRMEIAKAELEVIDYRVNRATIRAPADGVILSGDVLPRIGEVVPLGEPLVEFGPEGNWAIELHLPEYATPYIEPGQIGVFTTNARPDEAEACRLSRVEVSSEIVNGHNVFVAEAQVDRNAEWIRVGMTGVARIEAGRRPVWWVGLHRVIDTVRLQMWKL